MIPDRQAARLFQGAKISLGTVTSLGRALVELRSDEIAFIIGTYMTKSTETLADGRRLHRGSVGRAIRALWPGEDEPPVKVKREVTYHLRRNGFAAVGRGEMFQGWEVPHDLQDWREPQDRKPRAGEPEEVRYASPLTRSWICTICPEHPRYVSEEERDKHVAEEHVAPTSLADVGEEEREEEPMAAIATVEPAAEPEMRSCPVCGKEVERHGLPSHMKAHVITTHQAALLDLIRKHPGEHREFYVTKLGRSKDSVSGFFAGLHTRGVVHRTGKTRQVRWWPASKLDHDEAQSHVCGTCGQAFPTSRSLAGHRNREHGMTSGNGAGSSIKCPYCDEVFPSPQSLRGHIGGRARAGDDTHKGGEEVGQKRSTGRKPGRPKGSRTRTRVASNGSTQGVKGTDIRQATLIGDDILVIDGKVFRITGRSEIDLQGLGVQG